MRKTIKMMGVMVIVSAAMSITAYAGEWQSTDSGLWRWKNDDGSYPSNSWQWLDGNRDGIAECYYFDESGYLLTDTTTPDNYQVNSEGAWIVDGHIQIQQKNENSEQTEKIQEAGFVKQEYLDLLGKSRDYIGSLENTYYSADSDAHTYTVGPEHDDVIFIYYNTWNIEGKADRIVSDSRMGLFNIDKHARLSTQEMSERLAGSTVDFIETDDSCAWLLSKSPMIYVQYLKYMDYESEFITSPYTLEYYDSPASELLK